MITEEIINKAKQVVSDMYPYPDSLYVSSSEATWIENKRELIAFGFEMGAEWMKQELQNKND